MINGINHSGNTIGNYNFSTGDIPDLDAVYAVGNGAGMAQDEGRPGRRLIELIRRARPGAPMVGGNLRGFLSHLSGDNNPPD